MKQNRTCDVYKKLNKRAPMTYKNEKNGSCDVNEKRNKMAPCDVISLGMECTLAITVAFVISFCFLLLLLASSFLAFKRRYEYS